MVILICKVKQIYKPQQKINTFLYFIFLNKTNMRCEIPNLVILYNYSNT